MVRTGSFSFAMGLVGMVALCGAVWSYSAAPLGGRVGDVLIEVEGNPMGNIPSISSSCLTANTACIVAVPGGSLRLTGIHFPNGPGTPGAADAVGYVNGRFVSGTIQLSTQAVHAIDVEGHDPAVVETRGPPAAVVKRAWPNGPHAVQLKQQKMKAQKAKARKLWSQRGMRQLRPVNGAQKLAGADHDKAAEAQYTAALAAVEGHMKERMDKVEEEATKIAEAVTRVITSPEVSKKIADLAMDAASAKAAPASEASMTGGVQDGVSGEGQFGYSNEPAGTQGAGCGPGCAGAVATTPDLDTVQMGVSPPPPASTAFYAAWKASGAQTGTVRAQQPKTVVMQPKQMGWPAVGQPMMPYTLSAAMMGANGFVHGEAMPEDPVSVEAVGDELGAAAAEREAAPEAQQQEMAAQVQLHQMNQIGANGGAMMAQMQSILSAPGGAAAAAQYQQHAQLPTSTQQAPARARGGGLKGGSALPDPWGAFSAFQSRD